MILNWLNRQLSNGLFSRLMLVFQVWLVYRMMDWSWAFASTALATKADLMGAAAVIGAVAAAPQALLALATNRYIEMRAKQPVVISDRRKGGDGDSPRPD